MVYGVEDSESDRSYEDVLFTVTCSIPEAVQDPDLPPVDPSKFLLARVMVMPTMATLWLKILL